MTVGAYQKNKLVIYLKMYGCLATSQLLLSKTMSTYTPSWLIKHVVHCHYIKTKHESLFCCQGTF